jgi:hypothetical protein
LLLEQFADLDERCSVARFERHGATEVVERDVGVAILSLEDAELAVQKCAIGGRLERALITSARLCPPAGGRGGPRRGNRVLKIAEAQDLDPPGEIDHRAVDRQRRFERSQRLVVAAERQQRLPASDERRDVLRRDTQRQVERVHRTLVVLLRQRHVGRTDLGREQRRRPFQRQRKFTLGVAEIVVLQIAPAEIDTLGARRPPQFRRHDWVEEVGVPRHGRKRWHDCP